MVSLLSRLRQHAAQINAATIAILGVMALIGWHIRQPILFQLHPDFAPMQYNTALCFISCSLSLLLHLRQWHRTAIAVAAPAALIATLTLLEYLLDTDLWGIDQWFMEAYVATRKVHPGRPALLTAITLAVSTIALGSSGLHRKFFHTTALTALLSSLVIAASLLGFIGYAAGLSGAFSWSLISQMSLPTVIGFMALGIGMLSLAWRDHEELSGRTPHWLPVIILIASVTTTFLLANALRNEENRVIRKESLAHAAVIKSTLLTEIGDRHRSLRRMAERCTRAETSNPALWRLEARQYMVDDAGYRFIARADENLRFQHTEPLEAMENSANHPALPAAMNLRNLFNSIRQSGRVGMIQLGSPEDIYIIAPIESEGKVQGAIVAAIDQARLFGSILPHEMTQDHHLQVKWNGILLHENDGGDPAASDWSASLDFHLHGGNWTITVWPDDAMVATGHSFYSRLVVALGLIVSLLLGLSGHLSQVAGTKSAEAAERNVLLQQEIIERIRSQKQLQVASALNQAIVQHAGYSVITADANGIITSFNPAAERMLGYRAAEVIGIHTPAIIHDPGEVAARARMLCEKYRTEITPGFEVFVHEARRGIVTQQEWTYVRKDGSRFPVSLVVSELRGGDAQTSGFLGVASDISELKNTMAELKKTHEKLVAASLQVGRAEVATNILHNVGNVLNSVNVSAALLSDRVRNSRTSSLAKICALLKEQAADLPRFFAEDRRGRELPDFLEKLSTRLDDEQQQTLRDLGELDRNIHHIKEIVAMQQNYAKTAEMREPVA
ncbi:MAG TPA: PAS domain S-box protein, partial [Luteolibacter sp.]|nr:PAS domain S-box protein [Luteolibacter sp.]